MNDINITFEDELMVKYGPHNLADRLSRIVETPMLSPEVILQRKRQLLEDASNGECWFWSKSLYVNVFSNFYPCLIEPRVNFVSR